jgi:CheY-like chemotaxis protein
MRYCTDSHGKTARAIVWKVVPFAGMADKAHWSVRRHREVGMRRILVVDDDRHTGLAIGIWLKQCGFRIAITDGGETGFAALNNGAFDLMIVDVFMPNMRGFESIRVFRSYAPTVPLIAISGDAFSAAEADDPACFSDWTEGTLSASGG